MFDPRSILDIKVVLDEAYASLRQTASTIFARKEPRQFLRVGDDSEALELYVRAEY